MSWMRENTLNCLQSCAVKVIKSGHVPRHVAFIMDGNRRYASKKNYNSFIQGHTEGFDKLAETLQWCLDLGVKEVTVYAFSIENFKRSKEEVDELMTLAENKFQKLLDEREKLMEHGVRICVIGNLTLIPENVRKLMDEAVLITKDNSKALLNVAFAYTSRDEIVETIKVMAEKVSSSQVLPDDIDEKLFSEHMYTRQSSDPDLIIRTSGEVRFSDFLLWQFSYSYIYFSKSFWPEFNIWDFLTAIFYYQRNADELQRLRCYGETENKV
ncbi:dehydrodolichyl diphosphate synthase complex subunit DHDDS [Microplitis mediator]|uniref:dehydrodolichyl diphosphate synthase complex subunit DHDDS n=1 Tax=Microplitis mediator TaxID=375433 RepID=UPI002554BDF8|nr:dehydrodolichyl diphosphate synthase complex subunit DHDDS [Microplitis mediator]